jgi:hypothetical protein
VHLLSNSRFPVVLFVEHPGAATIERKADGDVVEFRFGSTSTSKN